MSQEIPHFSSDEIEPKLTALLLGELPPDQAEVLRRAIAQDSNLANLHQRLKQSIDLLQQAVADPISEPSTRPAPLKLSDDRRQQLLAHLKTVSFKDSCLPPQPRIHWAVPMSIAAVLVGFLGLALFWEALNSGESDSAMRMTALRQNSERDSRDGASIIRKNEEGERFMKRYGLTPPASAPAKPAQRTKSVNGVLSTDSEKTKLQAPGPSSVFEAVSGAPRGQPASFHSAGLQHEPNPGVVPPTQLPQSTGADNSHARSEVMPIILPSTPQAAGAVWADYDDNGVLDLFAAQGRVESKQKAEGVALAPQDVAGFGGFGGGASGIANSQISTRDAGAFRSRLVRDLDGLGNIPSANEPASLAVPRLNSPAEAQNTSAGAAPNLAYFNSGNLGQVPKAGDEPTLGKMFNAGLKPADSQPTPTFSPDGKAEGKFGIVQFTDKPALEEAIDKDNPVAAAPVAQLQLLAEPSGAPQLSYNSGILKGTGTLTDNKKLSEQTAERLVEATPNERNDVALNVVVGGKVTATASQSLALNNVEKAVELNRDPALRKQAQADDHLGALSAKFDSTTGRGIVLAVTNNVPLQKETPLKSLPQAREADLPELNRAGLTPPVPQPEVLTRENGFSTFSLNVSDVSFKLAAASLEKGAIPEPAGIRSEEFINAFDYRDPEPQVGVPVAFAWERAAYPFAQNRDLLRFSLKTAAVGRQTGRPLNLVLALDNSGSMERADRVSIIREALKVLAAQLQPQDKLSVVTFARTARLFVDGVSGDQSGKALEELARLTPEGGTNLEEAMNLAYQTALRHYLASGVNRVVVLTDGAANLGNVQADVLKQKVEIHRKQGVALDCFGIGWEGYNDDLLEVLSRNGDGRYGFINSPQEAAAGFAGQLAGALNVAASDVKVQVEFNPARVTAYRQIGYAKHQLTKEQFRDNTVDAAEIGAAESGNALYIVEVNPAGAGPLGTVRIRYKVPGTADYHEHAWIVPFTGNAVPLEQSSPAMRLAATAGAFSEWLASSPFAGEVALDRLLTYLNGVPEIYGADGRPKKLEWMVRQAKSVAGK